MPLGLKRYQHEGEDHFLTFNCYSREPHLGHPQARDTFLLSLELMRQSYGFDVLGYVVMPEHVHLLVSEPSGHEGSLATAIQALKISVSRRAHRASLVAAKVPRLYVFTHNKRVEKLRYMHRNPVKRRLVENPEDWAWSSYRHYLLNEPAPVRITKP